MKCNVCGGRTKIEKCNETKNGDKRFRTCVRCGTRLVTMEKIVEEKFRDSDAVMKKRERKYEFQREKEKRIREFCRKTNCLECPLPECYEERSIG